MFSGNAFVRCLSAVWFALCVFVESFFYLHNLSAFYGAWIGILFKDSFCQRSLRDFVYLFLLLFGQVAQSSDVGSYIESSQSHPKSILKLPGKITSTVSAPVSPLQDVKASKHLMRMRSVSLVAPPTVAADVKHLRPSRHYNSKLCSISWFKTCALFCGTGYSCKAL